MERISQTLRRQDGFTLVEILVVTLILAVLSGLAIPRFVSQADKARDGATKEGLATARTAIEAIGGENGSYAGVSAADLEAEEPTVADVDLAEPTVTDSTYVLEATSGSGAVFTVTRNGGLLFDCAPRAVAGCPSDGDWSD